METSTSIPTPPDGPVVRWRTATVGVAALGPLAIAAVRGLLPYDTTDPTASIVDKIVANPAAMNTVLWLSYLALLTLPLGVLITGRAAARARPVFGTIAAVVAWLGFTSLFASVVLTDYVGLAATTGGIPNGTTVTVWDAVAGLPATAFAANVFVVGHILGVVLLAIALWRVIPTWAAIALAISQPLHLVFAVIVPNHALDAACWALTAVGFAAAAWASTMTTVGPGAPVAVR